MHDRTIAIESRIQFRSKSIIAYNQYHPFSWSGTGFVSTISEDYKASKAFAANAELLKTREKYTGQITKGAKKRLSKAISLLIQSSPETFIYNPITKKQQPHKLSFITLTLPNVDQAKDAKFTHKYLLQPMLRIMRNHYKMISYVWKSEIQKNGSIHYHITTELFMPWDQLRQHWNAILLKNGMLEAFQKQYGHDNPNSVDIHAVDKVNDLEAYLIKYISKETQNEVSLQAKVWDCSRNLKASKYFSESIDQETHDRILNDIANGWARPVYGDKCVILKYTTTDYYLSFSQQLINKYYSHITDIRSWENNSQKQISKSTTGLPTESNITSRPERLVATKVGDSVTTQFYQTSINFPMKLGAWL